MSQLAADRFFVGELTDCARTRVTNALGKKSLETVTHNGHEIEGAFITANLARAICAHCLKNGELNSKEVFPFRLFVGYRHELTELESPKSIFSHIGYRPKKQHQSDAKIVQIKEHLRESLTHA